MIRIARAATHDVVARDFISAAKARGHSRMTIIRRELVPNVLDTLMVEGAMRWSWMLLAFLITVVSGVWGVTAHAGLGFDDCRCAGLYVVCPLGRTGPGDRPVVADYWHQSDGGCAGKSAGH